MAAGRAGRRAGGLAARRATLGAAGIALLLAGCSGEGTGPSARKVELRAHAGATQYGVPSQPLADPFEVLVLDAGSGAPVEKVEVTWSIVAGTGGSITVLNAESDEFGVARALLRLGADTGAYAVHASAARRTGAQPRFEARAIRAPQLDAATATAAAGSTIELSGTGFHPTAAENTVRFGGIRGQVLSGSSTRLSVRVPGCVADRATPVFVEIGGVRSNTITLTGRGPGNAAPHAIAVGEVRRYSTSDPLACLRLQGLPGAEYLVIVQNAAERATVRSPFELAGFLDPLAPVAMVPHARLAQLPDDQGSTFELSLRIEETGWVDAAPAPADRVAMAQAAIANVPALGERRTFKVLKADRTFTDVTAEVRHVSTHAILYQDVRAPAGGFLDRDFEQLGAIFDDPIHGTTMSVFGQPSDIDANGRIIILFTPAVNELTQPAEQGFIAGYFYGCDLLDRQRCSGSNRAEIFYSMVPDPSGTVGRRHTVQDVMRTVPAVLAHEFQHMIHFAQKNSSLDHLWLSEGLAHAAEDVVADALQASGRLATAAEFRTANHLRGRYYLQSPGVNGFLAETVPGTLAMRGGAWLLLKYLMGHHGGTALLGSLTRAPQSGVPNIVARTQRSWAELLADFSVALYADGTALPVDARYTFLNFTPRAALSTGSQYPLATSPVTLGAFAHETQLGGSGTDYLRILVPAAGSQPVHLSLAGRRGGDFAAGTEPQVTVLRIR